MFAPERASVSIRTLGSMGAARLLVGRRVATAQSVTPDPALLIRIQVLRPPSPTGPAHLSSKWSRRSDTVQLEEARRRLADEVMPGYR